MRAPVWIYAVPDATYALVRGHVGRWLKDHVPAYRSNMNSGWWLRSERVSDVVANLELDGYRVVVRRHAAPPHIPDTNTEFERVVA